MQAPPNSASSHPPTISRRSRWSRNSTDAIPAAISTASTPRSSKPRPPSNRRRPSLMQARRDLDQANSICVIAHSRGNRRGGHTAQRQSRQQCAGGPEPHGDSVAARNLGGCEFQGNTTAQTAHRAAGGHRGGHVRRQANSRGGFPVSPWEPAPRWPCSRRRTRAGN